MKTIFKLRYGAGEIVPETIKFFPAHKECDAIVRLSEAVMMMDEDPNITCAWAALERLPDSIYPEGMTLANWTKTSDETPVIEGYETAKQADEAWRNSAA